MRGYIVKIAYLHLIKLYHLRPFHYLLVPLLKLYSVSIIYHLLKHRVGINSNEMVRMYSKRAFSIFVFFEYGIFIVISIIERFKQNS